MTPLQSKQVRTKVKIVFERKAIASVEQKFLTDIFKHPFEYLFTKALFGGCFIWIQIPL